VCACQHDESEVVLDVRTIPHAVRRAAVRDAFGALTVEFLVEEPGECHVRLTRTASAVA